MTENFCVEHQQAFFKKGKMKAFAHPIKDESGETIGWCNKPEQKEQEIPPTEPTKTKTEMAKTDWAEKDRVTRKSIERQTALNASIKMGEILTLAQIEVFKINKVTGELALNAERVINTAQLFEEYLETGLFKSVRVSIPTKEVQQAPMQATASIDPDLVPKSLGQLYTWVNRHKTDRSITARDFVLSCGVREELLNDVPAVYKIIKEKNKGWKDYPE